MDPAGFQQEVIHLGDTELGLAQSITLHPKGVLGATVRSSVVYCKAHALTARGVAEDWMVEYLRETHHLTSDTIKLVCQHLIDKEDWKSHHFIDAMTPECEDREMLDSTVVKFRTALDVVCPDNTQLCDILLEHAEAQCGRFLSPEQSARVLDQVLNAMTRDIKAMSDSVIDALIQTELSGGYLVNSSSASAAAPAGWMCSASAGACTDDWIKDNVAADETSGKDV
jgi:hypothetical protein